MYLTAFFHIYGVSPQCPSSACHKFHFGGIVRAKLLAFNIISCFPVFGQIIGYYMIMKGVNFFKEIKPSVTSSYRFHKMEYSSMIFRGVITVLGLGILCLLLDLIVSGVIFVHRRLHAAS